MKKVRAKYSEKPLNELMRFLFCRFVEPIKFSSRASMVNESDSEDKGEISLCFVNIGDRKDSEDFEITEKNEFYANYTIVYERKK
jgi:hypothetical protein